MATTEQQLYNKQSYAIYKEVAKVSAERGIDIKGEIRRVKAAMENKKITIRDYGLSLLSGTPSYSNAMVEALSSYSSDEIKAAMPKFWDKYKEITNGYQWDEIDSTDAFARVAENVITGTNTSLANDPLTKLLDELGADWE